MKREEIDQLYHQLRRVCTESDGLEKNALHGLASHLLSHKGDYTGLLSFLDYYGAEYVLPDIKKLLMQAASKTGFDFMRVVELGAGFGWLGRGLSTAFSVPALLCDGRQWTGIDVVADIESTNGIKRILDELLPGDLIVMADVLHCLDNPAHVLSHFCKYPMLIVEYRHINQDYMDSYNAQIAKFGCKIIADLHTVFDECRDKKGIPPVILSGTNTSHLIWLVTPSITLHEDCIEEVGA